MAQQGAQTREQVNFGNFMAGTSVFFGSTVVAPTLRTQVNAPINLSIQRKITTFLDRNYATKFTKMLKPSPDYGTVPVPESYVAICHTDNAPDVFDLPGADQVERYASGKPEPYEIAKCEQIRYVASAFLPILPSAGSAVLNGMRTTNGVNVDVYRILFLSENAVGVVPLKGMEDIELGVHNAGKLGMDSSDPLGQRAYVAWKMWHASLILNQLWISRAEVGATA